MSQAPVAVSILTGFLGAGKTTLLNRLLKEPDLGETAVIINEFGEVSLDHLLVEQATEGIIELAGGCLCCTVRGDLVDTLADLIDRMQTGRIAPLKRIVIETSGLADPVPVLQSVMGHPALVHALRLDGVVTVVDAVNGAATLDAHETALRQVAVADRLVLTKASMAGGETVARLSQRLGQLNPAAPLLDAEAGTLRVSALFDCGLYDPATRTADVRRWLGETRDHTPHDHHHHDDHGHDHHHHHHHDDRIRTFTLEHDRPVDAGALEMFLDLLRMTQGEKLLRMKGIVQLAEDPDHPVAIHGVQKIIHPPASLPAWPGGDRFTRLVLITMDLPEDYVRRLFSAVTAMPAVDTPDRAALAENPLAVPGLKLG